MSDAPYPTETLPHVELTVDEVAALRGAVEDQRRCRALLEAWEEAHVSPLLVAELAEALRGERGSAVLVKSSQSAATIRTFDRWRYPW